MSNDSCKDCRAHGRVDERLINLHDSDNNQWKEINEMKKWRIATLTTSVFTSISVIAGLAFIYFKHLAK